MDNAFFSRILIVGSVNVSNRTPLLVAELFRRCKNVSRLAKTYFTHTEYPRYSLRWLVIKSFGILAYNFILAIQIQRTQIIFVLPSNNTEIGPIAFWAKVFQKPIILDYYVSVYEWSTQMQKCTDPTSKMGRNMLKWDRIAYQVPYAIHCNNTEWSHIAEVINLPVREKNYYRLPLFTDFEYSLAMANSPTKSRPYIFGWWGSSMPLHGLDTILNGFKLLADKATYDFELHLCFLGIERANKFRSNHPEFNNYTWIHIHYDKISSNGQLQKFINDKVHVGFSHFGTGSSAEYVYTNKILEAMALGKTSIVFDCPGNYEYGDIHDLFYVCDSTASAICDTAIKIIEDPDLRESKENKCLEHYRSNFSTTASIRQFNAILDNIYTNESASRPCF